MLSDSITRRIFVVPLANNNHGKTTIIRAIVNQGARRPLKLVSRGTFTLTSPWGRSIDALIIPRSYQETLRDDFGSVENALDNVDPEWRIRDLVIFPSHLVRKDCRDMLKIARAAGFDVIVVPIFLDEKEVPKFGPCLSLLWNERWSLLNLRTEDSTGKLVALGNDLWAWISAALEHR